ncbi:hypothetical protein EDD16DRAFT_1643744 [Pisolithus croceorrhizus]|nr:hypothetical protein EDD16DRAFT_1643744 [Pisolithus croceorrhizus]KAI6129074.1 hypothetical protein EV401DRAFT_1929119 [Pisolithus croceorrhizus]
MLSASSESFAMIRGDYMDVTIFGATQVSWAGGIANSVVSGKSVKGIGGATDLVSDPGKTKVIAVTEHCAKGGSPKVFKQCSLPLAGARAVDRTITAGGFRCQSGEWRT